MKIAYISSPAYSDVDLSFLSVAQDSLEIDYYIDMGIYNKQAAAIDLIDYPLLDGINKAVDIPYFQRFKELVDLNRIFVLYNSGSRGYSPQSIVNNIKLCVLLRKYDIIHITTEPNYGNPFIYRFRNRLVLTVHDPIRHSSDTSKIQEFNRKVAFRFIKHLILLNKNQKEEFIKTYKISSNQYVYDSNLCAYDYLKVYSSRKKRIEGDYILFFGAVTTYKGVEYLQEAMCDIHNLIPNVHLIIAGKHRYNLEVQDVDYIHYYDRFIPDDELANLIQYSKLCVLPYNDATQSGVVMSAFAFNKPCIATNVGGLPEMVVDGKYGVIVEPRNSKLLGDAIIQMLADPKSCAIMSENIDNDYHHGNNSWYRVVDSIKKIYSFILQK